MDGAELDFRQIEFAAKVIQQKLAHHKADRRSDQRNRAGDKQAVGVFVHSDAKSVLAERFLEEFHAF